MTERTNGTDGRVAVVTGAGRGIGREIARRLAAQGLAVLVTDADAAAAAASADEIGGRAWSMGLDVRDAAAHGAAAEAAAERGTLSVWVNNAGVLRVGKAWEHTDADVRTQVEVNLLGVIWGSRAAVDTMRRTGAQGGHVLNVASISALGPVPGFAVYAATKHAVVGFTTSLQGDLDDAGVPIRVHALCPDAVRTGMVDEVSTDPHAGVLFSGTSQLSADAVADRAMALLEGERLIAVLPPSRGALLRLFSPFPRGGIRMMRLMGALGERRRRRVVRASGSG